MLVVIAIVAIVALCVVTFGSVGGLVLLLTRNPAAACAADAAISAFLGQNLENVTGGQQRSNAEIWLNTRFSAVTAAIFSKGLDKLTGKLSSRLATKIPALSRLAGPGSYDASFKMVLTKLTRGQISNITMKTIRNGVVSGLSGDMLKKLLGALLMASANG